MNIIGAAKNVASGVGKMLIPQKKAKQAEPKNFLHESPEEYAERLMARRSQRH